jgi:hypothetical protein
MYPSPGSEHRRAFPKLLADEYDPQFIGLMDETLLITSHGLS